MQEWDDDNQDQLIVRFFSDFSRFEHALKVAGYFKGNHKRAEPDWPCYAKSVRMRLRLGSGHQNLEKSVKYLLDNPPKKEAVVDGELSWVNVLPPGPVADKVLVYVRRVRNNLFHGGKYQNGQWSGSERDKDLVTHCLVVLRMCREFSEQLQQAYEGNEGQNPEPGSCDPG